jgi:hypothetical protein
MVKAVILLTYSTTEILCCYEDTGLRIEEHFFDQTQSGMS